MRIFALMLLLSACARAPQRTKLQAEAEKHCRDRAFLLDQATEDALHHVDMFQQSWYVPPTSGMVFTRWFPFCIWSRKAPRRSSRRSGARSSIARRKCPTRGLSVKPDPSKIGAGFHAMAELVRKTNQLPFETGIAR